ncbi:MAG: hypothetical protein GY855_05325 [candidate division Zixibacteria bacterium]|nr:hypothetical protein [candidate division Zixibacteria bacterium]
MGNFKRFAIATTLWTYFLIFIGGLVRVSGAGLGCPDWPKCFGSWIPPLNASQLPADIDPNLFNFTLAWIEFINRLIGVIDGILIAILAIWALVKYIKIPRIVIPSVVVGLLVAFQGWHGSQVVSSELEPVIVSVHMIIALAIVGLLINISQETHYHQYPESERNSLYSPVIANIFRFLWIIALFQIIKGTNLRESLEIIAINNPLLQEIDVINLVNISKYLHLGYGIIVFLLTLFAFLKLMAKTQKPSPIMWQCAWTTVGLIIIQISLGIIMMSIGAKPVLQVLHLWVASLIWGVLLISFGAVDRYRRLK